MGGNGCTGQFNGFGVSIDVVVMAVRIDNVGDLDFLIERALNGGFGRECRINQHAGPGFAVGEQIAEIAVAAYAKLFKNQLHLTSLIYLQSIYAPLTPL